MQRLTGRPGEEGAQAVVAHIQPANGDVAGQAVDPLFPQGGLVLVEAPKMDDGTIRGVEDLEGKGGPRLRAGHVDVELQREALSMVLGGTGFAGLNSGPDHPGLLGGSLGLVDRGVVLAAPQVFTDHSFRLPDLPDFSGSQKQTSGSEMGNRVHVMADEQHRSASRRHVLHFAQALFLKFCIPDG